MKLVTQLVPSFLVANNYVIAAKGDLDDKRSDV